MKKVFVIVLIMCSLAAMLAGCGSGGGNTGAVYEDMQAAFEESGLLSANIGIFTKTEADGNITYGECGSGVIFEKENGVYYALTAAHVVSSENALPIVFTVDTEMKEETVPGLEGFSALTQDTYEAMLPAEVAFVSHRDDLAVIRFASDEDLSVIELAEADPAKGDRILCVGNPQNDWFAVSYGTVTSGKETFGETHGYPSTAMRHSAYIHVGSSGGAAIGENMRLVGITPGASLSPNGKTFRYGVLIPVSEIRACLSEWNR